MTQKSLISFCSKLVDLLLIRLNQDRNEKNEVTDRDVSFIFSQGGLAAGRSLRVYAFCTAEDYWTHTQVGGVTLVVLNTAENATEFVTADGSTGASLGR
jgi:hypothetical protein